MSRWMVVLSGNNKTATQYFQDNEHKVTPKVTPKILSIPIACNRLELVL